jgi:REP element-mobilizing transposase RayT
MVDVGPLSSYTYVWLLRDPNAHLNPEVSQAITAGLQVQLKERAWQIRSLEAREDYVYVVADIPGETPAPQIVRDLKRRAADIAHAQKNDLNPDDLWSDSYLIVTPGRDLAVEEIQQFINFERM